MNRQKIIVLDTNILFAALRTSSRKVRDILDDESYDFFTPNFLFIEIFKHKERILKHSKGDETDTLELLTELIHRVEFVPEAEISTENIIHAFRLCKEVDEKDTLFVALAIELDGLLWTRDEKLKSHLIGQGFDNFFNESN